MRERRSPQSASLLPEQGEASASLLLLDRCIEIVCVASFCWMVDSSHLIFDEAVRSSYYLSP